MTLTTQRLARSVIIGSVLASLALTALTGCSSDIPCMQVTHGKAACTGRGMNPGIPTPHVIIDWVDFIKFNGIMYVANFDSHAGAQLVAADLGPQFATVKFKTDGNVNDSGYHPKDGDAAFLDPGTPIYAVKGYAPTFLLAAYQANQIVRYEVGQNPRAATGADLLDIGGKVARIGGKSENDGTTELGAITDPRKIQSLVALVLAAPVKQSALQSQSSQRYFIAFHLRDGLTVVRVYWPESGELGRGIMLPDAFRAAILQVLPPHS